MKEEEASRSKPQASSQSTSTQHAPSVASAGKSEQQGEDDDDLPPREVNEPEASTSTPHASGTEQQPDDVADNIRSELPAHAGFDLAAMKAAIEDIGEGKQDQLEIPLQATSQPIPDSPELTPTSEHPSRMNNSAPVSDPTSASDRLLSVGNNNTHDAWPFESEEAAEEADEDFTSRSPALSTFVPHSRAAPGPTLSFDGDDGASWTPAVLDKDVFGGFGAPVMNPFGPTQFAAAAGSTALTSNTLSASLASVGDHRDPWSLQTYADDVSSSARVKKPSVFAANPWES